MDTPDLVHQFMLHYQEEKGVPPTLDEIQAHVDSLNYRSSARHVLRGLVADGRAKEVNKPSASRRYRAVTERVSSMPLDGFAYMPVFTEHLDG